MDKLKTLKNELNKLEAINSEKDETKRKVKTVLQNNNTLIAFFNDVVGDIVNIWNKYAGKQLGERTREKIKNEIEAAFDGQIFVYLPYGGLYSSQKLTVTTKDATEKYTGNTKIDIISKTWSVCDFLINNQIQRLDAANLCEYTARTYTSNLDATAEKIIALHAAAKQYEQELNNISKEIKQLSNYKIDCVRYSSNVSNWIL